MQRSKIKNQNLKFKIKSFYALILFLVFDFYALILTTIPIHAQGFSLGIYPPLLSVMIQPGKSVLQTYRLENYGQDTTINTAIVPFVPKDEFGNVSLEGYLGGSTPTGIEPLFSFENNDISLGQPFLLKAGETKQISLRIKIPSDALEDDHYFTLLFSTNFPKPNTHFNTQQTGVIGSNILLTISQDGQPIKKGEFVQFQISNLKFKIGQVKFIDSFDKPKFLLRVKNTGKTVWQPFGKIAIKGPVSQWQEDILPENVLANSIRQLQTTPSTPSASFLIGPYQASAQFSLEENGQSNTLTADTKFVAVPINTLLIILTGTIIIFIIKSLLKLKNRNER